MIRPPGNRAADRPPGSHGTPRRWLDGCRCCVCEGHVEAIRRVARRNLEPYGRLPVDLESLGVEHGAYRGREPYGCGCEPCAAAKKEPTAPKAEG